VTHYYAAPRITSAEALRGISRYVVQFGYLTLETQLLSRFPLRSHVPNAVALGFE
jgi:hypothetical protein